MLNSSSTKCLGNLPVDGAGGKKKGAVTHVKVLGPCHCRFTVMHFRVDTHRGRGYLAVRSNLT